jgi:hypothetical protein
VPDFDRLPQSQQDIWNEVAETVAAPMVAALHNALEQMAFASAALDGAGQVRHGLIAENTKLRVGLEVAIHNLARHRVFVTTREKVKHPEGTRLYDVELQTAREAMLAPTAEDVAKVAKLGEV